MESKKIQLLVKPNPLNLELKLQIVLKSTRGWVQTATVAGESTSFKILTSKLTCPQNQSTKPKLTDS